MKDPRDYLNEIQANLRKLQRQGQVTPTENALFGMIDGLAGLQLVTMERLAALEELVAGRPAAANRRRAAVRESTVRPGADAGGGADRGESAPPGRRRGTSARTRT